jgi:hypothetical protein
MPYQIRRVPVNTEGRDFVIGDLHGQYALISHFRERTSFDPQKDRLFSVGDLIDRGPDSLKCLSLLNEDWFYCVCGNHEEQFAKLVSKIQNEISNGGHADFATAISKVKESILPKYFRVWKNEWVFELLETEGKEAMDALKEHRRVVSELPRVIVVGDDQNRWQVVHAELWDDKLGRISDSFLDEAKHLNESNCVSPCDKEQPDPFELSTIEGRKILTYWFDRSKECRTIDQQQSDWEECFLEDCAGELSIQDCSPTFCGHTGLIVPDISRGHVFLDTLNKGNFLTVVNVSTFDINNIKGSQYLAICPDNNSQQFYNFYIGQGRAKKFINAIGQP